MGKVKDIREKIQIIITLGEDEQDILRTPQIAYKFQNKRGEILGEYFDLTDDMDVCVAVEKIIRMAQETIANDDNR